MIQITKIYKKREVLSQHLKNLSGMLSTKFNPLSKTLKFILIAVCRNFKQMCDRFIADQTNDNWHWTPQHIQTQICLVQFDFIGKFETLQQGKFMFKF